MHFFATCMVALGSIFSSIWIVVANSWMQTPAGHEIVPMMRDGLPWLIEGVPVMRAEILDFWAMVFNPSSLHRLIHVWIGCLITGSFFVLSISAWYLLHERHRAFAERSFKGALVLATIASLAALASGHLQARSVHRHQPAKLAALEAHFESGVADLVLLGWPDMQAGRLDQAIAIPGGLSFLLFDDFSAPVDGLDRFRPEDRPATPLPFLGYHVMISLGMAFIGLTLCACFFWWRRTLFEQRWLLWIFVFAVLGAVGANQAGWVAAETGRQPWIVHPPVPRDESGALLLGPAGVVEYDEKAGLRTSDAHSSLVSEEQVLLSMGIFGVTYALLFAVWIFVLNEKIQKGPDEGPLPSRRTRKDRNEVERMEDFMDAVATRPGHEGSLTGDRLREGERT